MSQTAADDRCKSIAKQTGPPLPERERERERKGERERERGREREREEERDKEENPRNQNPKTQETQENHLKTFGKSQKNNKTKKT